MAHELANKQNGQAAMAFRGQKPWHGLGQELTSGASIEQWKVEAGMDWMAKESQVKYAVEGTVAPAIYDGRKVIYRGDTGAPLSVVSDCYKLVQPGEVLEFFRDLTEQAGFELETAGVLYGGKRLWALAKTGNPAMLGGVDEIKPYLLIGTSLDGSMSTIAHFTSIRVVCNNTLRMAIGANGKNAKHKVSHKSIFDATAVKQQIGIAAETWEAFIQECETMTKIQLTSNEAVTLVYNELNKTKIEKDLTPEQMIAGSKEIRMISELFNGFGVGADMTTANGTGWGLINAVTQYYDHEISSRGDDRSRMVDKGQFGVRAQAKVNIANSILALAD